MVTSRGLRPPFFLPKFNADQRLGFFLSVLHPEQLRQSDPMPHPQSPRIRFLMIFTRANMNIARSAIEMMIVASINNLHSESDPDEVYGKRAEPCDHALPYYNACSPFCAKFTFYGSDGRDARSIEKAEYEKACRS